MAYAVACSGTPTSTGSTTNLALAGTLTSSSNASGYPAANAKDGNTSTYWESLDGAAYPQTLTAKLAQSYTLGSVTLTLPPAIMASLGRPPETGAAFWLIAVSYLAYAFGATALIVHLVPYLIGIGMPAERAALVLSVMLALNIIGKPGLGALADRFGIRLIYGLNLLCVGLGFFFLF